MKINSTINLKPNTIDEMRLVPITKWSCISWRTQDILKGGGEGGMLPKVLIKFCDVGKVVYHRPGFGGRSPQPRGKLCLF